MPDWFEQYLRQGWNLEGIYEDSVTFNIKKPETPFRTNFDYHKPVDPALWFNLEADLMGRHVIEFGYNGNTGDNEVVAEYDLVYAKPTSYAWLD